MFETRKCRMCGCTDISACLHADGTPCCWVEDDFCSACDEKIDHVRVALDELACLTGEAGLAALTAIIQERIRQVAVEGFTPEHGDRYKAGELAAAAGVFALWGSAHVYCDRERNYLLDEVKAKLFPFRRYWLKAPDPAACQTKAGALLLAQMERRYRAEARKGGDA